MFFTARERNFDAFATFVQGLDTGSDGHLLDGFREFLVLRGDGGSELWWGSLVLRLTLPDGVGRPRTPEEDKAAIAGLFDLLDLFLALVGPGRRRRAAVHREHQLWLHRQPWFKLDLERFGSSPAGDVLDLHQAAEMLGVTTEGVLHKIHSGEIRSGWIGAEVFIRHDDVLRYRDSR